MTNLKWKNCTGRNINMITLLTISNIKSGVVLMLAILGFAIVFSYLVVTLMNYIGNKEKRKAMATPIETAKNMGLNISDKYEEKNEILVIGKNYAFILKYNTSDFKYHAFIYERESGKYKMSVVSTDYNIVLNAAKQLVENLDKI